MNHLELKAKISDNARAIAGTPQDRWSDLTAELKQEWVAVPAEDWEPHYDRNPESPESLRLTRMLSSGLFLPNGYVAVLQIEPTGASNFEVGFNLQSLRANAELSLEADPIMKDCLSIGFENYPSMGVYKAMLAFMHSRDPRASSDHYEWFKELTGEYPSGGSAWRTSSTRYGIAQSSYGGATGMMHTPEVMNSLRQVPILDEHFDSESLISFRGSGAADHSMARGLIVDALPLPTISALTAEYVEQVKRGISLN